MELLIQSLEQRQRQEILEKIKTAGGSGWKSRNDIGRNYLLYQEPGASEKGSDLPVSA